MDQFPGVLTKSGSAYEHLKKLIVEGRLRPDRRLAPNDLAGVFRVSVTPVRDALVRLATEGYIRGEAGRGYFTKRYTVEEQHDLFRVLVMALLTSLLDLARVANPQLAAAFAEVEAAGRAAAEGGPFRAAEGRLLEVVAENAGGTSIPALIRNAEARTRFVRDLDAEDPARRAATAARLSEVGAAFAAGRVADAVHAGQRLVGEYKPQLPELVRRANLLIAANRFP